MNSVVPSLHPDLNHTSLEGVEGIDVQCIKGEVYEWKDNEGDAPTSLPPSSGIAFHDRCPFCASVSKGFSDPLRRNHTNFLLASSTLPWPRKGLT